MAGDPGQGAAQDGIVDRAPDRLAQFGMQPGEPLGPGSQASAMQSVPVPVARPEGSTTPAASTAAVRAWAAMLSASIMAAPVSPASTSTAMLMVP